MQITSLSSVNTVNIRGQSGQAREAGGFANLLSGQMQMKQSTGQKQVKENGCLSNEELAELTQFLQLEDIKETENGTELFQQMLSNGEMDKINFIKQHLNLSDQDLLSSLLSFLEGVNLEQTKEVNPQESSMELDVLSGWDLKQTGRILVSGTMLGKEEELILKQTGLTDAEALVNQQSEQDLLNFLYSLLSNGHLDQMEEERMLQNLTGLSEAFSKGNAGAACEALIELLTKMDMKQAEFMVNRNATDAIKSLKLFQLLSKYETSESEQKALTELLEKVDVTLNGLLREDKTANRKDLLYQIFTPLFNKKHGAESFKQTHSLFPSEEQIVENSAVKSLDSNSSISLQFHQMAKSEQLVLMMEKSGQPVSSEQMIAQFEKILATSQMMKSGNTQRMFIKLNPDHLGMLKVELIHKDTGMIAKITAATGAAKEILESQLQSLKNAFGSQNIQLDKIEITLQTNEQEHFLSKNPQQENQERDQEENKEQKQQQPEEFAAAFAEALISAEA